jgi:excinuclease ABC subunit B
MSSRHGLAVGHDPLARESDVEAAGGAYSGERPFGRAANLASTRPRKPTDADMGPHTKGRGEARPKGSEEAEKGEVKEENYCRQLASAFTC